jgi:hypothetical protein
VARSAVFFFIGNHSGLASMAETVKKRGVATTFLPSGESTVKVFGLLPFSK